MKQWRPENFKFTPPHLNKVFSLGVPERIHGLTKKGKATVRFFLSNLKTQIFSDHGSFWLGQVFSLVNTCTEINIEIALHSCPMAM
jgi:hypothetical protein